MDLGRIFKQSFLLTAILLISSSLTFGKTITVGVNNAAGLDYDYEKIQPAIDAAEEGDTVLVAEGNYLEAINFKGKNIILTSTDPNSYNMATIGHRISSRVTFEGNENETCLLQGFTITRGGDIFAGAINGNGTKATIKNCKITNNSTGADGAGLYDCDGLIENCIITHNIACNSTIKTNGGGLYGCDGTIQNCTITDNRVGEANRISNFGNGGGLCNCNGQIINCTIENNQAWGNGGGLYNCNGIIKNCVIKNNIVRHPTSQEYTAKGGGLYNCNEKILNCIIENNFAEENGGGLSDCNSVTNCIISGNTSGGSGAGLYDCNNIINCTIVGNYSQEKAGALYLKNVNATISNTIIWDNLALEGGQILVECNEPNTAQWNLSVDYSDIEGGPNDIIVAEGSVLKWEPNNIDIYPMFVQPGSWTIQNTWNQGDYHLLENSPCIDTGDPNLNYTDQNDIDFGARVTGQYVDMGADEYAPVILTFVQLEISGPGQLTEGESGQYTATGRYDNDTTINLTNEATWSVEPEDVGTIDSNGLFIVGDINESQEVTIKATYTPDDQEIIYIAQMTVLCENVPETATTYHVDKSAGNDTNDGLSRQTAFKTIQAGINASQDGDTVLVFPGVYQEGLVFWGKNITLKSAEDAAIIENPNNIAVLFCFEETSKCKIQNFVIRNSEIGILNILNSSPTIKNLTIVNNDTGIQCFDSTPEITNCIFRYNSVIDFDNCLPEFSCMEHDIILIDVYLGNIVADPLFANPQEGDYHLKSESGRYWSEYGFWTIDYETSPCINTGNPIDNFINEPQPNGGRINMGAYGNTNYASMSSQEGNQYQYKASQPYPANGAIEIPMSVELSWTAGLNAQYHDVYFNTNLDDVMNASRNNLSRILVSEGQTETTYLKNNLQYNTTYFWRIDEIDSEGTITKGDIWTFDTYIAKGRSCFTADTPVWVHGKMMEISKVIAGQTVGKSDSAMSISGSVTGLEEHGAGMNPCYEMTLESGNTITIVHSHYFKTVSGEWMKIEELSAGMQLQTMNGPITIKSVVKKAKPFLGKSYNLMLDGSEQYFVGIDGVIALDCSQKTWEILEEARK